MVVFYFHCVAVVEILFSVVQYLVMLLSESCFLICVADVLRLSFFGVNLLLLSYCIHVRILCCLM